MSCSPEKLYQLEFVVKSISRCGRPEDIGCGASIAVRIINHAEQTVCDVPPPPSSRSGTACAATQVDQGKTFTFSIPGGGAARSSCTPKPVRIAVKLYKTTGSTRTELASGDLDVFIKESAEERGGCRADDDHTVAVNECSSGRTLAVLSVRARAWAAGTVTSAPVEEPPCSNRGCRQQAPPPPPPTCDKCPKKQPPPCCPPPPPPPSQPRSRPCPCNTCRR